MTYAPGAAAAEFGGDGPDREAAAALGLVVGGDVQSPDARADGSGVPLRVSGDVDEGHDETDGLVAVDESRLGLLDR
ncbi:hypothetical protein AB0940_18140 [Streptomyces sp. NPDC006656]|uniref:hypothetical protein n=1 Tax=Streptomyces sp. NPDC006656 TaxID=3156899 RepID=UPI003454537E